MRTPPRVGELERVGDEVAEDLAHPHRVAAHGRGQRRRRSSSSQRQALGLGQRPVGALHRRQQLAQVEGAVLERELAGLDLREVEDVGEDARRGSARCRGSARGTAGGASPAAASARSASRARPSRPFSGVRISWLVLARKALLARLAASAASRAAASACVEAAPLGHVLGDPDRAACARVGRVDRLAEQAAPEAAAVARRISRSISNGLPGGEQRPGERADLGVVGVARPDDRARLAAQLARPASRTSRSKRGLACTKRRSRVNAMPIEARSRIASCSQPRAARWR